jgi:hypothetical protein
MTCSRWIAVCADVFEHEVLSHGPFDRRSAWLWLIANAAWKSKRVNHKGKPLQLERGQVLAGRRHLAETWGWGEKQVRNFVEMLRDQKMIEGGQSNGHFANVITICNYDRYQTATERANQSKGQSGASAGPERGQTFTKGTTVEGREESPNGQSVNYAARETQTDRPAEKSDLKTAFNGATATMVADVAKWMGVPATDPLAAKWLQSTLNANGQQATATAYAMLAEKQASNERIVNPLTWWGKTATSLKAKQPAPAASGIRCSPGTMRNAKPAPEVGHA